MKSLLAFSLLLLCSGLVVAGESKYSRGDCITPTNKYYSWTGKFARVEAFSEIDGFSGKVYILTFPNATSNDSIYGKTIEKDTKLVDKKNCLIGTHRGES